MTTAVFVLSTGRCGTQWLAEQLRIAYGDVAHVEHEPLHDGYSPRLMLAARGALTADAATAARVAAHADIVRRHLQSRNYVECGHPCWSAIPWLCGQFPGHVRVVHLSRHPVPTALSWLTHQVYQQPLLPHLVERVLLAPSDDGVAFPEYRDRWTALTPFEKCLYYWAEVHAFGLTQRDRLGVPWLHVRYEDLFGEPGMTNLLRFLDLSPDAVSRSATSIDVDRFRYAMLGWPDVGVVSKHPRLLQVAGALGYDASDVDAASLRRRYMRVPA
jgi:hypothetical protein